MSSSTPRSMPDSTNRPLLSLTGHAWRSPKSMMEVRNGHLLWSQERRGSTRPLLLEMRRCSCRRALTTWMAWTSSWEYPSKDQLHSRKKLLSQWCELWMIDRESWGWLWRTNRSSHYNSRVRRVFTIKRREMMNSNSQSRTCLETNSLTCMSLLESKEWIWRRLCLSSTHLRSKSLTELSSRSLARIARRSSWVLEILFALLNVRTIMNQNHRSQCLQMRRTKMMPSWRRFEERGLLSVIQRRIMIMSSSFTIWMNQDQATTFCRRDRLRSRRSDTPTMLKLSRFLFQVKGRIRVLHPTLRHHDRWWNQSTWWSTRTNEERLLILTRSLRTGRLFDMTLASLRASPSSTNQRLGLRRSIWRILLRDWGTRNMIDLRELRKEIRATLLMITTTLKRPTNRVNYWLLTNTCRTMGQSWGRVSNRKCHLAGIQTQKTLRTSSDSTLPVKRIWEKIWMRMPRFCCNLLVPHVPISRWVFIIND